jgi:hypothetical protein
MEKLKIIFESVLMYIFIIFALVTSMVLLDIYFDYTADIETVKPSLVLKGTKMTIENNKITLVSRDTIYELYIECVK